MRLGGFRRSTGRLRFPERCAFAREREYLDEDLRQLLFKSHRIVFTVEKKKKLVYVLYIRHASRRAVGETAEDEAKK